MRILDQNMMKKLSFPDYEVEKMEFFPQTKTLALVVDGGWLDVEDGVQLGKGVLFFKNWENLLIRRYNPLTSIWTNVEELSAEPLRDLCEVKFFNSSVNLCGFGKELGFWLEWQILNTEMYAEFIS